MNIEDFRIQIENWPRNRRGRLMISDSNKVLIRQVFNESGVTEAEFCAFTGLKKATVVRAVEGRKQAGGGKRSAKPGTFHPVKVIATSEESTWIVNGPSGLHVKCRNISQLTQLWRSLC